MAQKDVLLNVQRQKIKQTQVHLIQWMSVKQSFLKKHIPIQQRLIKKMDNCAQNTMLRLRQSMTILKDQRELNISIVQKLSKNFLSDQKRFNQDISVQSSKVAKKPTQTNNQNQDIVWSNNIDKVFNCMANSNKKKIVDIKQFIKIIQKCQQDIQKQQKRYQKQIKSLIKSLQKTLQKIDSYQKQQQSLVANIKKDSKNKDRDGGYYLIQYKKIQIQFKNQFLTVSQRADQIFNMMKNIIQNEKACAKRIKEIFQFYMKSKSVIFKENKFDQQFLGALMVIENNISETRKQFFNKFLLHEDQICELKTMVPEPSVNVTFPNLEVIILYLRLGYQQYLNKLNAKNKLEFFSNNLTYKRWHKAALAQGWLITSYVNVDIYLTYDHKLSIFNKENNDFIRKVGLKQARITKIQPGFVVYLEEVIKGFFSDSKQQYKLKFEGDNSMQQFMEFVEHKV